MRPDLLDSQGAIDWAEAQLPTLQARVESWGKGTRYRLVTEPNPEIGKKLIKLTDVKPLDPIINAEVGAIINGRASLRRRRYEAIRWIRCRYFDSGHHHDGRGHIELRAGAGLAEQADAHRHRASTRQRDGRDQPRGRQSALGEPGTADRDRCAAGRGRGARHGGGGAVGA